MHINFHSIPESRFRELEGRSNTYAFPFFLREGSYGLADYCGLLLAFVEYNKATHEISFYERSNF